MLHFITFFHCIACNFNNTLKLEQILIVMNRYIYIISLLTLSCLFSANIKNNGLSVLYGDNVIGLSSDDFQAHRVSFEQKNCRLDDSSIKKRSHKRRRKIRRPREGR